MPFGKGKTLMAIRSQTHGHPQISVLHSNPDRISCSCNASKTMQSSHLMGNSYFPSVVFIGVSENRGDVRNLRALRGLREGLILKLRLNQTTKPCQSLASIGRVMGFPVAVGA